MRHALVRLGLEAGSDERLARCIGPPLQDAFADLGVPAGRVDDAIARYREHYDAGALHDVELHAGVPELLARLIDRGCRLGVATSKPWVYAERILDELDLRDRFDVVAGAELDGTNRSKADVVADALRRLGGPDPSSVVLVGDRHHDVRGARAHGVGSIGVGWGFAEPGELAAADADLVVDQVAELAEVLTTRAGSDGPPMRRAVRAIVADRDDRVLLVHWLRPHVDIWISPGGGVESGERTRSTLQRELVEEIGLHGARIGPIVLTRSFQVRRDGTWRGQRESWRLVRVDRFDPPPLEDLPDAVEEGIVELRWWTLDELRTAPEGRIQHDTVEAIAAALAAPEVPRPVHTSPFD